jgi:hypothetical protein
MTDATKVEIDVDTFSEGDGFFVRTEINARSVCVRGPFANMQAAQSMKAAQLASSKRESAALEEHLRRAMATLAKG